MPEFIFTFDGTFAGYMSAIFEVYRQKITPLDFAGGSYQKMLDTEEIWVDTDKEKSSRVIRGIQNKISHAAYEQIYQAFLAKPQQRFMDIYHYIDLGLKVGKKIRYYETDLNVISINNLSRKVYGEAHLYSGFLRFSKTESGVLYSEITPENNVLELVAGHFKDRLIDEKWVILDTQRKIAAMYNTHQVVFVQVTDETAIQLSEEEQQWQDLWRCFHKTIAVQGRIKPKLQRSNLPLRYRKHMTEFQTHFLHKT